MKNIILSLFTIFSVINAIGQINHEQKIIDFYGQDWYHEMETINPGILLVMDSYIDSGFVVQDIVDDKYLLFDPIEAVPVNDPSIGSVSVFEFLNDYNSGNFNPLIYQYYPGNAPQVYRLKGVNKIILIQSQESLLNH